jgi:hypothetical protein
MRGESGNKNRKHVFPSLVRHLTGCLTSSLDPRRGSAVPRSRLTPHQLPQLSSAILNQPSTLPVPRTSRARISLPCSLAELQPTPSSSYRAATGTSSATRFFFTIRYPHPLLDPRDPGGGVRALACMANRNASSLFLHID